jgi:hypothetical protein
MKSLSRLAILAVIIATTPAWAAGPGSAVTPADPDTAFRTPGGEAPAVQTTESSPPNLPGVSPGSLPPGTAGGPRLLDQAPVTLHYPPTLQMAQAAGASSPAPGTAESAKPNPWIFGATIYLWVPFATSTSTISSLPPVDTGPHTSSSLTNLYGGAGDFQLSKGDWGAFANVAGSSLGFKGVLLREDPLHPTEAERSAYTHYGAFAAQYGLSYRLFGQPLDLTTWAHGTQPIAFDLLAGGQTLYTSVSVKTASEQAFVSAALTSPLVGARMSVDLADRWNLGVSGNVGGFGVSDTSLTWQANLAVFYRFLISKVPAAVSLGFRVEGLNFDTGSGQDRFKLHEILYGPLLGFSMFF